MNDSSGTAARRGAPRPRLSPHSRLVMVERVQAGQSKTAVAAQMGCSRQTVDKWVGRYAAEGAAGLEDRSSRPHASPAKTPERVEKKICRLRRSGRLGPARLAGRVGVPASTVHRVLVRHGLNRLAWIDRPTGERVRRYEKAHPGELVHVDVKKVAKVPPGGGWRAHGRGSPKAKRAKRKRRGYTYLHVAVDDHSRVAYVEAHDNDKAVTAAAFWRNARDWFNRLNVGIDAVMDRQRPQLHLRQIRRSARREPHQASAHPPLPAPDQRQSRAVQPHPRRGVPLQLQVPLRTRPQTPPPRLDAHLQSPPAPHRHRSHTRQPRQQPRWTLQLVE